MLISITPSVVHQFISLPRRNPRGPGSLSFRVSRDKAGDYQCVTTSGGLSRRRTAVASLPASLALAALGDFPPATGRDDAVEAFVGNDVVIDCTVPDSNPPAFVQFYKASEPFMDSS